MSKSMDIEVFHAGTIADPIPCFTGKLPPVLVPQVRNFEELNRGLEEFCQSDRKRRLRGQSGTKEELLKDDQAAFLPLPLDPFDACRKVPTTASSLSLV